MTPQSPISLLAQANFLASAEPFTSNVLWEFRRLFADPFESGMLEGLIEVCHRPSIDGLTFEMPTDATAMADFFAYHPDIFEWSDERDIPIAVDFQARSLRFRSECDATFFKLTWG